MIIRTAVIIATLMIVITKSGKNDIYSRNEQSRRENSNSGHNCTSAPLTAIQVKPVTAK